MVEKAMSYTELIKALDRVTDSIERRNVYLEEIERQTKSVTVIKKE